MRMWRWISNVIRNNQMKIPQCEEHLSVASRDETMRKKKKKIC